MYALAKSQACPEGNKRVALLLTSAFVRMNGGRLNASHDEIVERVLFVAASAPADREGLVVELTEWMRDHLTESEEDEG